MPFSLLIIKNVQENSDYVSIGQLLGRRNLSGALFDDKDLAAIQSNFHAVIRDRCENAQQCLVWLDKNKDRLPKITGDLLNQPEAEWFPVSGMYGGFSYGLIERDGKPLLITDNWSRIVDGSGERHEITPDQVVLTAKGFV